MTWNPQQYNLFKDQRSRPFHDLMRLIQENPLEQAIDLGCGTGELTQQLFQTLKIKTLLGIDSSEEMLQKTESFEQVGLHSEKHDIGSFSPSRKWDLVFSNAALQWIPDHETLFPKILDWVKPGGQVAIQVPCNFDHPSHTTAVDVAHQLFPQRFGKNEQRLHVLTLERYAEIFYASGMEAQITRMEVYGNPMKSGLDVVEWTKGTMLTHYQSKMSADEFKIFLDNYREQILRKLGDGPYFYPFKRMLLWGKKK